MADADITALLRAWQAGVKGAENQLFEVVYAELRRQAIRHLRGERPGHTLAPTALVNEAYVRLARDVELPWQDRAHFLAVASRIMRHVLVDHARARRAAKRPDALLRVTLEGLPADATPEDASLLDLDAALTELEALDPRLSQIAVLRYMAGLSVEEIAHVLEISPATVKRDWLLAKAWLHRRLS